MIDPMSLRVVSGGQTGADQAGWRAAKRFGIPTFGWMPNGFLTEDGLHPEFAELYGAKEHSSKAYPPRTKANINEACVTIWFGNPKSPGGILTTRSAKEFGAFVYVIESPYGEWQPKHVARHVLNAFEQQKHFLPGGLYRDKSINIAGNRESSSPGIGEWVETYLCDVFREMGVRT